MKLRPVLTGISCISCISFALKFYVRILPFNSNNKSIHDTSEKTKVRAMFCCAFVTLQWIFHYAKIQKLSSFIMPIHDVYETRNLFYYYSILRHLCNSIRLNLSVLHIFFLSIDWQYYVLTFKIASKLMWLRCFLFLFFRLGIYGIYDIKADSGAKYMYSENLNFLDQLAGAIWIYLEKVSIASRAFKCGCEMYVHINLHTYITIICT